MYKKVLLITAVITTFLLAVATGGWADVPAPPANQTIGMDDVAFGAVTEADCRVCHDDGVPDRHHGLYDSPVPDPSVVPYPEFNTDGNYSCMSCHSDTFIVERDCAVCHGVADSPHHGTAEALARNCVACHGDLVDYYDDGHYIPTYAPSLVTPTRSGGDGLPLNSEGNGAGACNYCHDDDGLAPPVILTNMELHHGTGFYLDGTKCFWCHDMSAPFEEQIRKCEDCHGPDSLHNIQVDSPNVNNVGTIVVGGEDAGYGHVGRDAGPSDSDCWGCHGFAASTEGGFYSGPIIPTVNYSDLATMKAGTDTTVTLFGSAFTNTGSDGTAYASDVLLTASDGSAVILEPDFIAEGELTVTIPDDTAPGNYNLQAVKAEFSSNPAVISIFPEATITEATCANDIVTITGSNFSESGSVITTVGKKKRTSTVEATILSWSDTTILADFGGCPSNVTVITAFNDPSADIDRNGGGGKPPKPCKGKGCNK